MASWGTRAVRGRGLARAQLLSAPLSSSPSWGAQPAAGGPAPRRDPLPKAPPTAPRGFLRGHGTPPPYPQTSLSSPPAFLLGRAPSGTGSIVRMVPIRLSRLPRGRAGSERGCCCSSRSHCSPRRGSAGRARAPCPAPRGAGVTARRSEGRSAGVTGGAPKGRTCQAPSPELRKTREASKWPELLEGGKKSGVFGRLPPLCA